MNKKIIENSINCNMIIFNKKIKNFQIFFKEFLKRKNKHALIRKFNTTSNEKKIMVTQLLKNIKTLINLFPLYCRGKDCTREKKKKLKELGPVRGRTQR
jgi:hypothetical protein